MSLGSYPTPIEHLSALSRVGAELWVKRDDRTASRYGGNKVRKLEHLLEDARARKKTRIVTIGAAGSHHVLATGVFAIDAGFGVDALLVAQPRTEHVANNLRASLRLGVRVHPVTPLSLPFELLRLLGRDAYFVTAGGSNTVGSLGYVDAARELAEQVKSGVMPEPELIVTTLGSGGTVAGLAAGLEREGLRTRVLGVAVADPPWLVELLARRLARGCARRIGVAGSSAALDARLVVERRYLGRGYGHATPWGGWATQRAAAQGIALDATYTAKAFACALDLVRAKKARHILYWHTLSSAPMAPLLDGSIEEREFPASIGSLLR